MEDAGVEGRRLASACVTQAARLMMVWGAPLATFYGVSAETIVVVV